MPLLNELTWARSENSYLYSIYMTMNLERHLPKFSFVHHYGGKESKIQIQLPFPPALLVMETKNCGGLFFITTLVSSFQAKIWQSKILPGLG